MHSCLHGIIDSQNNLGWEGSQVFWSSPQLKSRSEADRVAQGIVQWIFLISPVTVNLFQSLTSFIVIFFSLISNQNFTEEVYFNKSRTLLV